MREVNGYAVADRRPLNGFTELRSDGSTASGCWIYCGYFADGVNQARRREPGDVSAAGGTVSPQWAWAWPANRRILYNRASADPQGRPWSERKRYMWWEESAGRWSGYDVPDFPVDKRPDYRPGDEDLAMDAIGGDDAVHHDARRPGLSVHARRAARRATAHPLRADRVAGGQPALPEARGQSVGDPLAPAGEPARGDRRSPLSGHRHQLPSHRAAHHRGDEPQRPLAGRAAARDVRRDRSGRWPPSGASRTAAG